METLLTSLTYIVHFGIVLGLAVVFHEWGHFIIAKLCGAKVERFAVGFGKKLVSYQRGETEYALCALPLGGYVKITGMDPDDEVTGAEHEFLQLSPWRRILIVLAGPFMNFVLAFLIYFFLFIGYGQQYTATTTVGHVPLASMGWEMGLHEGDQIQAINGRPVSSWEEVTQILNAAYSPVTRDRYFPNNEITLSIERGGQTLEKNHPLPELFRQPASSLAGQAAQPPDQFQGIFITDILADSPASQAGLEPGMIVKAVDGKTFNSRSEWSEYISQSFEKTESGDFQAQPLEFTVVDQEDNERTLTVTPKLDLPAEDAVPYQPKTTVGIMYIGEISVKEYFTPSVALLGVAPKLPPVVGNIQSNSAAEKAGLKPGSRIVEINGEPVDDWIKVLHTIHGSIEVDASGTAAAKPLEITWLTPEDKMKSAVITPKIERMPLMTPTSVKTGKEYPIAQIGMNLKADRKYLGVVGSFVESWNRLVEVTGMMVNFLGQLFTGQVSPKLLGGPIAIFQLSGQTGSWGLERLFGFIALLSANLGLINLFPLPPLDGGHIVFYCYEIIRRKPITMKQMENFGKIGIIVILPLIAFLFINDLYRIDFFGWVLGIFQ